MSELFGAYTASFLHGLSVYAHVEASVSAQPADTLPPYITLSQRLTADGLPFIVGLAMPADAFYAIAAGYSGVCLDTAEELAVDAAGELFNVINGHFSSEMRARGHAVSKSRRAMRTPPLCLPALSSDATPQVRSVRCTLSPRRKNFSLPERSQLFERSSS